MTKLFSSYATPFITALFLISLVSGVGLFVHIDPGGFHGMHEWLSMVLILPFGLHLWKNWRPMVNYFRHMPMVLASVASALAAGAFMLSAGGSATTGGSPQFQLSHLLLTHSLADVAPVLGLTPDALTAELVAAGFTVADANQALTDIAATSGTTEADLAAALIEGGA